MLTGVDVLKRDNFRQLAGRKVGLITNHTGKSREGESTVKLLHDAKNVQLKALFSPEHGFEGKLDVSKIGEIALPANLLAAGQVCLLSCQKFFDLSP